MAKRHRSASAPKGLGRNDKTARISAKQSKGFRYQRPEAAHDHTGAFGSFRKPALVGVSDTVRISNRNLARRARREMAAWQRTLPKGVKI